MNTGNVAAQIRGDVRFAGAEARLLTVTGSHKRGDPAESEHPAVS
jgi:hypothetical protein